MEIGSGGGFLEVDLFVFDRSPEALDHHVFDRSTDASEGALESRSVDPPLPESRARRHNRESLCKPWFSAVVSLVREPFEEKLDRDQPFPRW